jgi:hypothetical protein
VRICTLLGVQSVQTNNDDSAFRCKICLVYVLTPACRIYVERILQLEPVSCLISNNTVTTRATQKDFNRGVLEEKFAVVRSSRLTNAQVNKFI